MEYRTILSDGTVMGYDQAATDGLCRQHGIVPEPREARYDFVLRALRHLTAKDIVSWTLTETTAPVVRVCHSNAGIRLGLLFLAVAAVLLLLMSTFST
jgi:hypothetical protein